MQSKARTVAEYLAQLPPDRRAAIDAVRRVVLANVDDQVEEGMQYGMIGFYIPHRVFPAGYHCDPKQPLPFIALASQKNYMSLYLMSVYGSGEQEQKLRTEWAATGRKLDMGKSCIRFKRLEDLPLDVVGRAIARVTAADYIRHYVALTGHGAAPLESAPAKTRKEKPARSTAKSAGRGKPKSGKSARSSPPNANTASTPKKTARNQTVRSRAKRT